MTMREIRLIVLTLVVLGLLAARGGSASTSDDRPRAS
jgi:hypothetical protein